MPSDSPRAGDRRAKDRRSSHTFIDADGTLVFGDRHGALWRVYDRRGSDRRSADPRASLGMYRAFISVSGEEWRCPLDDDEVIDETAGALERQLDRAIRHTSGSP